MVSKEMLLDSPIELRQLKNELTVYSEGACVGLRNYLIFYSILNWDLRLEMIDIIYEFNILKNNLNFS